MQNVKLNRCNTETGPSTVNVNRITLREIHQLNFSVENLADSQAFYKRALSTRRVAEWDDLHHDGTRYAIILEVPGLVAHMELRPDVQAAERQGGFDPVTIAIQDRDGLTAWAGHLDAASVEHAPVFTQK